MTNEKGLLEGIVVLDLTRVLAGPYSGMMMADMGATVIKLENPNGGDDTRKMGPFVNDNSVYYANFNRSKLGCTLNLKAPEGKALFLELVKKAAAVLGDSYDIEIVERHHRRKVDAPSGTALMIADAAAQSCGHETEYVYERHSSRHPRDKKEIGISAVRGGTIVGEHEIIFAGHDEIMEIKHTALSREIFAQGAVEAAKFIAGVERPGLYDMSCLVK